MKYPVLILIILQTAILPARCPFPTDSGKTIWAWQTFKDTRVINGHSVETSQKGEGKFIISHRFGKLSGGAYELFGIDQSTIRIGLDYAISGNLNAGLGRSSFGKTYDGYIKYKLAGQHHGASRFPLSIVYLTGMAINGIKWPNPDRKNYFTSRMSFTHQLLLARKFSPYFSLQLMPTLVHRNLVRTRDVNNDVFAIGVASRIQLTKVTSVQIEYYYVPPGQLLGTYKNSLSVGFEFDTKGHVFQIHLSNSTGMVEPLFITQTADTWKNFGIRLGFNITRDFQFTPRKF